MGGARADVFGDGSPPARGGGAGLGAPWHEPPGTKFTELPVHSILHRARFHEGHASVTQHPSSTPPAHRPVPDRRQSPKHRSLSRQPWASHHNYRRTSSVPCRRRHQPPSWLHHCCRHDGRSRETRSAAAPPSSESMQMESMYSSVYNGPPMALSLSVPRAIWVGPGRGWRWKVERSLLQAKATDLASVCL